jgi:hypothetical protein
MLVCSTQAVRETHGSGGNRRRWGHKRPEDESDSEDDGNESECSGNGEDGNHNAEGDNEGDGGRRPGITVARIMIA